MGLHEPDAARPAVHTEPAAAVYAFRGNITNGAGIGRRNRLTGLLLRPEVPAFLMRFGAKPDRH